MVLDWRQVTLGYWRPVYISAALYELGRRNFAQHRIWDSMDTYLAIMLLASLVP